MAKCANSEIDAQAGDEVKCVNSTGTPLLYGGRYLVLDADECRVSVRVLGEIHFYDSCRFKLIHRKEQPAVKPEQSPEPLVELVNHPPHYAELSPEPVDVIESWQLEWHEGNAMKYIARAKSKGERVRDLRKAAWYLNRKAEMLEKNS